MNSRYSPARIKERLGDRWDDLQLKLFGGCNPRSWWYRRIEAGIAPYQLPDLLAAGDGTAITEAAQWSRRRPEVLELFRAHVYGRSPKPPPIQAKITKHVDQALGGTATLTEVRIALTADPTGPAMTLLLLLPVTRTGGAQRVPVFLGLNFFGNHTIHPDSVITPTAAWVPSDRHTRGLPAEQLRGLHASSWPVELILQRGYGLATAYCGEIVPDRPDGLALGVPRWYARPAGTTPPPDAWGAVAGWAWGLSRALDYLVTDPAVAADQIAVVGHSRLGKAALWAGAEDERFAMVISNESGCAGATLFRRRLRETIAILNRVNPHWFCDNFKQYDGREHALPVDQHMLLALIAPRPLYVASAQLDLGADPMGEFLAAKHASALYRLLGTSGLPGEEQPPVNQAVCGQIGYHMRSGRHAVTRFDWENFLAFADRHFRPARV